MKIPIYPVFLIIFILISSGEVFGHGMSEAEKQTIIEGSNFQYILIGAKHMLSGYDHLLFVFGIVFFLSSFKQVIKYITAFTLGHSFTLILATFNSISINYFLIDAIIGLSVCYIAFVNLDGFKKYLKIDSINMLFMIVVFGLIHGLGLSSRLQQLPLNMDSLLLNIISFNIGIEIGQIAALSFMLLLMSFFKKSSYFGSFSTFTNVLLFIAGIFFFIVQVVEYRQSIFTKTITKNIVEFETIKIIIPAHLGKEYKLWIQKDKKLEYSWKSGGEKLYWDFHGEPAGDTTGYFKSYKEDNTKSATGFVVTPFLGTHGWYWKNESSKQIEIILKIKGDYKRFDL